MAGIKSLFPGSLMPYACDVITTNVTSSKILVLSPFLKIMKGHRHFFLRLPLNAFPDIGSVGRIEKKNLKKITRTLGIVGPGTPGRR